MFSRRNKNAFMFQIMFRNMNALIILANLTDMYQLFIFFMITDPKTTVKSKTAQALVAFLVATTEHLFRLYGNLMLDTCAFP